MDKMPIWFVILYSIPESIFLISLSASLYGYDIKANFKKIFYLSVCLAFTTYVVRAIAGEYGENILVQLPIFIGFTAFFLKVSLKRSTIFILTGFVAIFIAEAIVTPLAPIVSGESATVLMSGSVSRLLLGWSILLVLAIPTFIVRKTGFNLTNALHFFKQATLDRKVTFLVILVLLQAFLAGFLEMTSIYGDEGMWPTVFKGLLLKRIIGFALFTFPIVSAFLLKRIFKASEQQATVAAQEVFIENMNTLFVTVRAQRHDFLNHVQVIYSLMSTGRSEEAMRYMDNLLEEIQKVNEVIKVKSPILGALLNSKLAIANANRINFETEMQASIENIRLKALDLVKILGNLLDNAIDAVKDQPLEYRQIKLAIKKLANQFVFEVYNPQPVIAPEVIENVFKSGFSTKTAGHSGLGLAVVKELAEKYHGNVNVKSTENEGTTFTVAIPA